MRVAPGRVSSKPPLAGAQQSAPHAANGLQAVNLVGILQQTRIPDSAPLADALTTCLSLVAQWLLNTKRIETWFFWIAADCIFIPLYVSQGLILTASVYVLFLGLCVAGLRAWTREQARPAANVAR